MASKIIVDQLEKTGGALTALTLPTSNASASEFLQNNGSGVLSWAGVAAGLNSVEVFTASGTWTKPAGVTKIIVEVQAGGGAGSRHTTISNCSGGTGGGHVWAFLDVTNIDTATVVVGLGGTGVNLNVTGAAGGVSSFTKLAGSGSFTALSATGGNGGTIAYETSTAGVGGSGPATDCVVWVSGNSGGGLGTHMFGSDSKWGIGGPTAYSSYAQLPDAKGYGGGGGGAYSITAGNGSAGLVIVQEYK